MFAADTLGTAIFVFLGVCVTAVSAWVVSRQQRSGRINTSEATKLWEESTGMRHELRDQVEALNLEIKDLKIENAQQRAEIGTYRAEVEALTREVRKLRARVAELESVHG